jgi:hypothetical protein
VEERRVYEEVRSLLAAKCDKIAVKVINHFGDEAMKVVEVK